MSEAIHKKLKQLMADSHVMFTKLHNYHWHVRGLEFLALHAKTEEAYGFFSVQYDDLAERLLQLGSSPLTTTRQIIEQTTIKESDATRFSATEVIEGMIEDYGYFLNEFKNLSDLAETDPTTQAYADEKTAYFEKELWMLRSLVG